jgi:hypothetical protein
VCGAPFGRIGITEEDTGLLVLDWVERVSFLDFLCEEV